MSGKLHGTWHLCAWHICNTQGDRFAPYTDAPSGVLHYAEDATMYAFLHHPEWLRSAGPSDFPLATSYSGRWSFADGTIRHEVLFSSLAETIGQTLVRHCEFLPCQGLILTTDPEEWPGSGVISHRLEWARMKRVQ